jgi:hypothetical protein
MLPDASITRALVRPAWLQVWAQAVDPNDSIARTRIAERFILFSVVVPIAAMLIRQVRRHAGHG